MDDNYREITDAEMEESERLHGIEQDNWQEIDKLGALFADLNAFGIDTARFEGTNADGRWLAREKLAEIQEHVASLSADEVGAALARLRPRGEADHGSPVHLMLLARENDLSVAALRDKLAGMDDPDEIAEDERAYEDHAIEVEGEAGPGGQFCAFTNLEVSLAKRKAEACRERIGELQAGRRPGM